MNKNTYYRVLKNIEDRQYKRILSGQIPLQQSGWIKHLRWGFGMSFRQLGKKLGMTAASAAELQRRELEGTITVKTLREAAHALGFDLFYMFIPKDKDLADKPLQKMVENQAREIARDIVGRTSTTMMLEDQQTTRESQAEGIEELTQKIKSALPRYLWD